MKMLRDALLLWRTTLKKRSSLQLRLLAFFSLFTLVLVTAFLMLMSVSGVFNSSARECRILLDKELTTISDSLSEKLGTLSVRGVAFADQLSDELENQMRRLALSPALLSENPEDLESLLYASMPDQLSVLIYNWCSGVFVILDGTVNPTLENADSSRAGIFLKTTEPKSISPLGSKIHYLRGPASIAREYGVELLGQWQMEFDLTDSDFFARTTQVAAQNPLLSLTRLYYWTERTLLSGNSESGLLLCLPLMSEDGTVFGICGLEVSSMLFKLEYSPDNSRYPRVFAALSPLDNLLPDTGQGLIAGNSYLTNPSAGRMIQSTGLRNGFTQWLSDDGNAYVGLSQPVSLYPTGSPFAEECWSLSVMMPESDFQLAQKQDNFWLYTALAGLLGLSFLLALYISRRYISPVVTALRMLKTDSRSQLQPTNIAEIDDLLDFLSSQDALRDQLRAELDKALKPLPETAQPQAGPDLSAYQEFVRNISTLSPAEKAVFDLYMEGHIAKEISELLFLSINTIKTHNKHIYTKLNVTSRKELMVYVQMMTDRMV